MIVCVLNRESQKQLVQDIANLFSRKDKKVLLIDLNRTRELSKSFGLGSTLPGIAAILKNNKRIEEVIVNLTDLDIIPSDVTPLLARSQFYSDEENEIPGFEELVLSLEQKYDRIIIDCPVDMSFMSLNAMYASDAIIFKSSLYFLNTGHRPSDSEILKTCASLNNTEIQQVSANDRIIELLESNLTKHQSVVVIDSTASVMNNIQLNDKFESNFKQLKGDYTCFLN